MLAAKQAELMQALWAKGPVPAGFDAEGVRLEGETLLGKRRRFVARMRPAIARALGRRFPEHFAAFAAANPLPAHACADASRFASWCDERLGDEDVLERIQWHLGLRALLASSRGAPLSADMKADLDLFGAWISRAVERRGPGALEEPRLKVALVLASLAARDVALEREQIEALRAELLRELAPFSEEEAPKRVLEAALRSVREGLALERVLARRLRPDQKALHDAEVARDPFAGQMLPRLALAAGTEEELALAAAAAWTKSFALGADAPVREIALAYARRVFATRAPVEDRRGVLTRTAVLLALQSEAEERLLGAACGEERERVARRRGSFVLSPAL